MLKLFNVRKQWIVRSDCRIRNFERISCPLFGIFFIAIRALGIRILSNYQYNILYYFRSFSLIVTFKIQYTLLCAFFYDFTLEENVKQIICVNQVKYRYLSGKSRKSLKVFFFSFFSFAWSLIDFVFDSSHFYFPCTHQWLILLRFCPSITLCPSWKC